MILRGMSGASTGACLGHHLGHVWGIIWGMSGACLGQHLGHVWDLIYRAIWGILSGQQSAVLHASVMPFLSQNCVSFLCFLLY